MKLRQRTWPIYYFYFTLNLFILFPIESTKSYSTLFYDTNKIPIKLNAINHPALFAFSHFYLSNSSNRKTKTRKSPYKLINSIVDDIHWTWWWCVRRYWMLQRCGMSRGKSMHRTHLLEPMRIAWSVWQECIVWNRITSSTLPMSELLYRPTEYRMQTRSTVQWDSDPSTRSARSNNYLWTWCRLSWNAGMQRRHRTMYWPLWKSKL